MSLVRSKAAQWGIDPKQIGMAGFSAGGHLAIATATSFEKRAYRPADDIDKTSCRPDFAILGYPGYLKAKDKDELAPGLRIPAGTPPIFLVHGGDDIISDPAHSVVMYLALKRAGIPAELHVYATACPRLRRPPQRPSLLPLDQRLRRNGWDTRDCSSRKRATDRRPHRKWLRTGEETSVAFRSAKGDNPTVSDLPVLSTRGKPNLTEQMPCRTC